MAEELHQERRKDHKEMVSAVEAIARAASITAQTAASATEKLVARVDTIDTNLSTVQSRQQELGAQLKLNTEATARIETNTAELVTIWTAAKGGLKVLGWIGIAAKWISIIAGCVAAVGAAFYAMTHAGGPNITPGP